MKQSFKNILIVISLLFSSLPTMYSQSGMENIRKLKIEIVLKEMNLNDQTQKKFLPLFTKYSDEALVVKRKLKALDGDKISASAKISEREQLKQELLDIEKKYKQEFLKFLTPAELEKMYRGEELFRKKLLELKK